MAKSDDIDKTERASQVKPGDGLQFITITDPSQSQDPKHKKIVQAQAMRYARGRVRSDPRQSRSPIQSSVSSEPCPHIQPDGSPPCSCKLPDDVYENSLFQGNYQGVNTDLVAVGAGSRSPVSLLGSRRLDPFGYFPIVMTDYMKYLVDYCE
jgi:hypothetical protein